MNKAQPFNVIIAAIALTIGLLGLGFILKSAALDVKAMERTVQVKGLAEIEVAADTVIWPLQFSDADNNLEKLVGRVENKNDAVVAFLKLNGFSDEEISTGSQSIMTSKHANMVEKISNFVISLVPMLSSILMILKKFSTHLVKLISWQSKELL